jgi:acyl-CoA synthetase (AMP-forming)/AMP-acid ligase II
MFRSRYFADPQGIFLHDAVLAACRTHAARTAIVDTSCSRRITYAEYGELVERLARGLVAAGLQQGEVLAIYLPNSWEFCVLCHAATLAGAIPTPLNPSYREREVRYQLDAAEAAFLVTDGPLISGLDLSGLPKLRRVFTTRQSTSGAAAFSDLLTPSTAVPPQPDRGPEWALAALPFSSGTTGLPKGVMLSHFNLVANVYQILTPGEQRTFRPGEVMLAFLPLYHIYGLNVVLNSGLIAGATLVLLPRFDLDLCLSLIPEEAVTFLPMVPPVMNAFCAAAEAGRFPREHRLRAGKSGAAPLAPELARRFTSLTGVRLVQGYGMTEASPVTHCGFLEPDLYRPDSIGCPVVDTSCRIVDEHGDDVLPGSPGELVMAGPQFMLGYWRAPSDTRRVLREGWYWSGDVVRCDRDGFFYVLDRSKEMIKYNGFPVSPAEVEAVLLEHPEVRDAGVVGRPDDSAGQIPCAFVVLRDGSSGSALLARQISAFVAERLSSHKQPREVRFVANIPRNPSGKILRRNLKDLL